jgi:hypothetical protein
MLSVFLYRLLSKQQTVNWIRPWQLEHESLHLYSHTRQSVYNNWTKRESTNIGFHDSCLCVYPEYVCNRQIATLDAELKDTKSQLEVINVVLAVCLKVLNEPLGAGDESNSTESFNRWDKSVEAQGSKTWICRQSVLCIWISLNPVLIEVFVLSRIFRMNWNRRMIVWRKWKLIRANSKRNIR